MPEPYDYKDEIELPPMTEEQKLKSKMQTLAALDQIGASFRDMKDGDGNRLFEDPDDA